jgi:hypothetical protein
MGSCITTAIRNNKRDRIKSSTEKSCKNKMTNYLSRLMMLFLGSLREAQSVDIPLVHLSFTFS